MGSVIVIGAGISGLTAAHALRNAGHDVMVFEATGRAGGRIHSERVAGFLVEHGANGMLAPAPHAEALIGELGLATEKIDRSETARSRYLVRDGRVRELPLQPLRFLLSGPLSTTGGLRVLLEPFVAAGPCDETVAAFARRRFGREFLDYVVDPLVGGLYAGDPRQLSVSAVFPQLKRIERTGRSVILAAVRSRLRRGTQRPGCDYAGRMLFSFRGGLGVLPQAMTRRLADRLYLNRRVESIRRAAGGGFLVTVRGGSGSRTLGADSVVIATPAYAAAEILCRFDPRIAQALSRIRHPPLAVAFLGYRADAIAHPLDGSGVLAPSIEGRNVLGMLFSSTLFPGRAPAGHAALTTFIGGARQPLLALSRPEELLEIAHREARELLGARALPVIARAHCWRRGIPQPAVDHPRRVAEIAAHAGEHPGLFLTGNYVSAVSVAACTGEALQTARRVERHLACFRTRARRIA